MKNILFIAAIQVFLFTSCQKELDSLTDGNNNGTNDSTNLIKGTWNFASMEVKIQNTVEYKFLNKTGKTISFLNYITKKNGGTILFEDSVINATGLTFTASYTMKNYEYKNELLIDSLKIPVNFTLPITNASGKYILIGTDSIYCPHDDFIPIPNSPLQFMPSNGKVTFNNNTNLTISGPVNTDTTKIISGILYRYVQTGTMTISLERK